MITNNVITIYHKHKGRTEYYDKYIYSYVWTFGGHGASLNKGLVDMNDLVVRIPYRKNEVQISNIGIGDLIVIGEGPDISAESDLTNYYRIMSITDNKVGSEPHIHIGAK